jgi:hypothetical protein
MDEGFTYKEVPTGLPAERALDVATFVANLVPWLGGAVAGVLSGIGTDRKINRINDVIVGLAERLRDVESEKAKQYVKTEEFEELLEQTLRQVASERNEEKRRIYRDFLIGAIVSPGEPYDEQRRFLRTMEELQPEHLRVLKALSQPPKPVYGAAGSPIATLRGRLADFSENQIEERIQQLNDLRVTNMTSLKTMMTPQGAENLTHAVTPYGSRFVQYLMN